MALNAAHLRPPAPEPLSRPLGAFALLKTLIKNPAECWTRAHFHEPIVEGGFPFAKVAVVSDPAAIRQILVENPSRFQKSAIERRILSIYLRKALVTVEGEQWLNQRGTLAPWFGRKVVGRLAPAMLSAAAAFVERWQNDDAKVVELKREMSRLSADVLVRCIFATELDIDRDAFCTTMVGFFGRGVRIDPFDVIGLPDFIPRPTRLRRPPCSSASSVS
jgi:cytochrome P450